MLRPTARDLETRPIINRSPDTMPDALPASAAILAPGGITPSTQVHTQWSPRGTFAPRPFFGGYDELSLEGRGLMHVPQADFYDVSQNPWPNNGQFDHPNSIGLLGALLRLPPHTSAHPGFSMPTRRGDPSSLFHAPPIFSVQQRPIAAVGI